ncbi:C40 family peptidase [Dawidia soli]|uniref:C40 family peptidase n=1 Tax=Dawidia soli TaxID=2782352 RepID=A0AAP2DEV4_9BACT|nr:C40 family peptidase [Dawidia soli]MBT1690523.1 C40 family peptidase [Dawidia soli]
MFTSLAPYLFPILLASGPGPAPKAHAVFAPQIMSRVAAETTGVSTGVIDRSAVITYAKTFKGIRYKYACADPKVGFDCSGFVMYVFNHFQIDVPRSSVDFTNKGTPVELADARPGDVILFTGTNSRVRRVGHVGIITQGGDSLTFIHASSGSAHAITETTLIPHYQKRFMKVIRVLE